MNRKKDKKIKKLSRVHIWPSILLLVVSMFAAFLASEIFVALMLANQMGERINSVCTNALSTVQYIDSQSEDENSVIKKMQESGIFPDSIFILDKDGNTLAGCGEATYNISTMNDVTPGLMKGFRELLFIGDDIYNNVSFCLDTDLKTNLMDENGNLNLLRIFMPENFVAFDDISFTEKEKLFEAKLWACAKISGDRTVIIKCYAPLYTTDFGKSLVIGILVFAVMLVPVVFFFINVIINFLRQHRMRKLLYTDTVTGGKNSLYFEHYAGKLLNRYRNGGKLFAVVDLTIMKYRSFRNFHGVHAAETLLESVDKEINTLIDKKEISVHSGKSSFALLLKCEDNKQGEERIRGLINHLSEKFNDECITFHAGIYFTTPEKTYYKQYMDPADCLSHASAARAALTDENALSLAVYDDKMLEEQLWIHKVEEKMQAALDNEEFKVYIQPKYNPSTNELAGAEALIRWINEEDGFISPGRFIPIFENNGFITKIDDYMISHVSKLQADWLSQGKAIVPVSVNVSRAHFANPELAQHICSLVDKYDLPHKYIEIELTESAFFDDKSALLNTVNQLRNLGFEVSMDDFGAGYSSLNSLKDLPLDVLKLDAEFFRGENEENRGEIVISQAIKLAKSLNMRIVAEGVEKKEQVDFLAGQGCDMIQGFYFAKPMPTDEYETKLS